ncbi:MAG TPA: hypothetical protein VGU66_10840 [Candidatus Elarobacter sp.]|nr:hypothetical protein [Candidatus Elarobacter sp.]
MSHRPVRRDDAQASPVTWKAIEAEVVEFRGDAHERAAVRRRYALRRRDLDAVPRRKPRFGTKPANDAPGLPLQGYLNALNW